MKKISKLETNEFTSGIIYSILKSVLLIGIQEIDVSLKPIERELIHFSIFLMNHGHYRTKKLKRMHHFSRSY